MQQPALFGGDGPNRQNTYVHAKNVDTTPILRGTPAVYAMNGTLDAFGILNSATSGVDKSTGFFAGIAAQDIPVGEVGMVLASGVADFVRCNASIPANVALTVNPAANNFAAGAALSAIIGVTTVGPAVLPALVNGIATATINGVANASARVLVRAL